jgi:hypothetical protein
MAGGPIGAGVEEGVEGVDGQLSLHPQDPHHLREGSN